jgi:hypothetical protein
VCKPRSLILKRNDYIIDVPDSALIQKRNMTDYVHFKKIADELLNFIYENKDIPRIIGIDGTYIPLSIELINGSE